MKRQPCLYLSRDRRRSTVLDNSESQDQSVPITMQGNSRLQMSPATYKHDDFGPLANDVRHRSPERAVMRVFLAARDQTAPPFNIAATSTCARRALWEWLHPAAAMNFTWI